MRFVRGLLTQTERVGWMNGCVISVCARRMCRTRVAGLMIDYNPCGETDPVTLVCAR